MNDTFSVYVHIPFCARKCRYCDFFSVPSAQDTYDDYTKALCSQIETLDAAGAPESIYLGGGTPSLIGTRNLAKILDALARKFDISDAERTAEINPESVVNVLPLVANGTFNRISMGIQSLDDGQLQFLGRVHTAAQAEQAYNDLRRNGAKNISVDIMTALPTENRHERLQKTLEKVISFTPEHVSAYLLTVEENTQLALCGVKELDPEDSEEEYIFVSDFLISHGYEHYEISNFARKGFRSVHNSGYWKRHPYIGLGAGAVGFDGIRRYKNPCDINAFIALNGRVDTITEETLTPESAAEEELILALRTCDGYDAAKLSSDARLYAQKLAAAGLAKLDDKVFAITPKGWVVCNTITSDLMRIMF